MKLHRFYIDSEESRRIQNFGKEKTWIQHPGLMKQWLKVLRLRVDDEVRLFDNQSEFIYRIVSFNGYEIELAKITEVTVRIPKKKTLLCFSILKKDKNDWILQKATELGVTHFAPINAIRSNKTNLNLDRSKKILVEAAEQCGRNDIPVLENPDTLKAQIQKFKDAYTLFYADESAETTDAKKIESPYGVFIGPEGGWEDVEMQIFVEEKLTPLHLGMFTLRAETAAIVASAKLTGILE